MDEDEAIRLNNQWRDYREYEETLRLTRTYTNHKGEEKPPNPVFGADTGATIDLQELAGWQHYIPEEYAMAMACDQGEDG